MSLHTDPSYAPGKTGLDDARVNQSRDWPPASTRCKRSTDKSEPLVGMKVLRERICIGCFK
jgi:hypothetical protein